MKKRIDPKLPIPDPATASPIEKALFAPDAAGDRIIRRLNELFRESDDGTVAIYDEGTYIGQADGLNFIGDAVTATQSVTLPAGIFDINVTATAGTGTTLDTLSVTASEDVAAGALINIWNSSSTFKGRNADASKGSGYEAHGWTDSAVLSGGTITVRFLGKNTHSSGLTPGLVWLGNGGLATSTAPSTTGYISQQVGVADSASEFAFEWHHDILLTTNTVTFGGTLQSQTFTSSGTFTQPPGVTGVWISLYAGGGAGSGGTSGTNGAGGGAGEYCEGFLVPISGNVTVTVGAGGAAGSAGGNGSDGSNTSFGPWTVLGGKAANGTTSGAGGGLGSGAASSSNGGSVGSSESPTFYGGSSGGGAGTGSGGKAGGGSGGHLTGGAAGSGVNGGGGGGATPQGVGGAGGTANTTGSAASANTGAGGGGGGGGSNTTGGAGGSGLVIVFWVG